jgi:signal transduction histidine kinase
VASSTVLVVDDEDQIRRLMAQTLEAAGLTVLVAADGAEALHALERGPVDLIVSDVAMPVMDGPTLYERVRSRIEWTSIPFVFLTASDEPVRVRSAYASGVDDYLVKPASGEDLVARVLGLLRRRRELDAARDEMIGQVKQSLLVVMNHELRTPLTTISGYAQLLERAPQASDEGLVRQAVAGIQRGTARLCRLAEDLVLLMELRSGEAGRAFERQRRLLTGLPGLLAEALESLAVEASERRVQLVKRVPPALPRVLGDPALISMALVRLLDNAVKFSKPEGGRVTLSSRQAGEWLLIEVEDGGLGIPAEELPRVFEPLYQVDRARLQQRGTGSGLAIARAAVALHGGELTIRSEVGVGSTVSVRLPIAAETS